MWLTRADYFKADPAVFTSSPTPLRPGHTKAHLQYEMTKW